MNSYVAILRHVDCEGPGYLLNILNRNDIPYKEIKIDQGEAVPKSLKGLLAIVSMGGGMSVNDDIAWIQDEIILLQNALQSGLPLLGHCLGAQFIAKAAGSVITTNTVKEIGWFDIFSDPTNNHQYWFEGWQFPLQAFHWHGETFSLPAGADNLLSSEYCKNQCFELESAIGFQCHIEMTENMVREWVARFSEQLQDNSQSVQSADKILEQMPQRIQGLNQAADSFYQRWVEKYL